MASTPEQLHAPTAPAELLTRYNDGYLTARVVDGIGSMVKGVGVLLGIGIAIAGLALGSRFGGSATVAALFAGVVVGLFWFVAGVMLSAQGQLLKASFDTAVNSSPFLSNEERLRIMSIKVTGASKSRSVEAAAARDAVIAAEPAIAKCTVCGTALSESTQRVLKGRPYCALHFEAAIG